MATSHQILFEVTPDVTLTLTDYSTEEFPNGEKELERKMTSKEKEIKDSETDNSMADSRIEIGPEEPPPSYSVFAISHLDTSPTRTRSRGSGEPLEREVSQRKSPPSEKDVPPPRAPKGESDCRGCEKKTKMDSVEMETWIQFTKNTTLHGIKYVFDDKPFTIRRTMWLLCVLTSISLFGYQAIDRVCTYFRYPSYVNVQVVYDNKVEFPTVTICNYNKYRLTAVVDRGLYQFINDIYRTEYLSGRPVPQLERSVIDPSEKYNLDSQNLTDFLLYTAHQKDDFIYSCSWQGSPCDIDANFTQTFTDFGVCYTFNSDPTNRLYVNKSGAGFALSLTLNIEQYEYMSGPEHEAGIKALLHDPIEIPQIEDLGFAVAPGTHTLVGIRRRVTDSLEAPYGTCIVDSRPRSYCLLECLSNQIIKECNCIDVYMIPPNNHSRICSMTKEFFCVNNYLALATKDVSEDCTCPGPCHKVTYDPLLSYAQLSMVSLVNFDRLSMPSSPYQIATLQTKYAHAREVAQRMNLDLADVNAELVWAVINATLAYRNEVMESRMILTNDTYLTQKYNVSQELLNDFDMVVNDFAAINSSFLSKAGTCLVLQPDVSDFLNMLCSVKSGFLQWDSNSDGVSPPLKLKLEECVQTQDSSTMDELVDPVVTSTQPPGVHNEVTISSSDPFYDCKESDRSYLYIQKNILINAKREADLAIADVQTMTEVYKSTMTFIFGNTSVDYQSRPDYRQCVQGMDNSSRLWTERLVDFSDDLAPLYINASDWATKLDALEEIEEFSDLTVGADSLVMFTGSCDSSMPISPLFTPCNWFVRSGWFDILSDRSYGLFQSYVDSTEKGYLDVQALQQTLTSEVGSLISDLQVAEDLLMAPLYNFLNETEGMTKMDLYEFFQQPSVSVKQEARRLAKERYVADWQQFLNKLSDINFSMQATYQNAFNLSIPAINSSLLSSLWILQYASEFKASDDELRRALAHVYVDGLAPMLAIIDSLFSGYRQVMQDVQSRILQSFQVLETATNDLESDLEVYAENGELDDRFLRENFIKVDIFYKDLAFEKINLQVGFEVQSLFSEIGGLLGLLLGASILTVLELVDFVMLVVARRFRRRNQGDVDVKPTAK